MSLVISGYYISDILIMPLKSACCNTKRIPFHTVYTFCPWETLVLVVLTGVSKSHSSFDQLQGFYLQYLFYFDIDGMALCLQGSMDEKYKVAFEMVNFKIHIRKIIMKNYWMINFILSCFSGYFNSISCMIFFLSYHPGVFSPVWHWW